MPFSAESAATVRATLPVVGAAIDEITRVFYRKLFAAHPLLESDLFNRGNQAQGDQQRALAGAVAAYATMLVGDDTAAPDDILSRVANKHASLGITADQYPIVHEHLFAAIGEVLGEQVTDEVAAAWNEVYWHMAAALIEQENALYARAGVAPGQVWRPLVVTARRYASPHTVTLALADPAGAPLPPAGPGQYISVAVALPDGTRQIRQYSLVHALEGTGQWSITIKAVPAGTDDDGAATPAGAVSTFLFDNVFEGDRLQVSPPFGDLVLDDTDAPLVLISAGIGCTPIIAMLHYLAGSASKRQVLVLHADRSPAAHAHRQDLKDLVAALPSGHLHRWYEDLGVRDPHEKLRPGRVDLDQVTLPDNPQVYLCGPLPFMAAVRTALRERRIPESRIHYEVFGPDTKLPLD